MKARLNLGIVGCGDIAGYTAWLSKLIPSIRLAACCDINIERAKTFAKKHRIPRVHSQVSEILADPNVDALYLAVPHYLHYEMILAAVQANKPVFVEKPVTRTFEEATRLVEMLHADRDRLKPKVGVNYQYRYDRGCYALAKAVQSGALGQVHSIRINIPWHRQQSYFDNAPWHKTIAQAGGGTLITQGSHFLDIALWALGEAPVSAMGCTATPGFVVEVDTLAHGIVETEGRTLISITSSMAAASEQAVQIEVYGARGTAIYNNRTRQKVHFIGFKHPKELPPEQGVHALQRSLAGFVNWVLHDKPFLTPAEDTLAVLAAVEAIYRSAKSNQKELVNKWRMD